MDAAKTRRKCGDELSSLRFLYEASKVLSSTLDLQQTFNNIARLCVPLFCDYCVIDVMDDNGEVHRIAAIHKDRRKSHSMYELMQYAPVLKRKQGPGEVMVSGKLAYSYNMTDAMLQEIAQSKRHLMLLRALNPKSVVFVPLKSREITFGCLTLAATTSRVYSSEEKNILQDLGRRAGMAVDNAYLYSSIERELERRKEDDERTNAFIGFAGHELKSPLASIKAYIQLMHLRVQKTSDPTFPDILRKIDRKIDILTKLINDYLDITRIRAGKFSYSDEQFSLSTLLQTTVDDVQQNTDTHRLVLKNGNAGGLGLYADKTRIRQVFLNLFENAVKYSPKSDKVEIGVLVEKGDVYVSIKDYGVGISKQLQGQIFEPFFRISEVKGTTPGMGLGLSLCSKIVKHYGGYIYLKSAKNRGSTFTVRLPLHNGPER